MKKFVFILMCVQLAGCSTLSKNENLNQQVISLQETLKKKDAQIQSLEKSIAEKDQKIDEQRKKFEMFGVFD